MKTTSNSIMHTLLALLLSIVGFSTASAADVECFSRGVAHCILNDGSGTFPVMEAGQVFVSLSADATPEWADGTYTSAIATKVGNASSGSVKQTFYFWAKANAGYRFIGWNTSKTGKTAASGSDVEGAPYAKTYTHWSAGTAEAPKEQIMYAVFEKTVSADEEPTDLGDGIAMTNVENNSFVAGSSNKNIKVRINFAEGLLYNGTATPHDAVNQAALPFVSCRMGETTVSILDVATAAAFADETYTTFLPAYGTIELPSTIAVGEYDVHLPYGLFKTAGGGVTAPADFKFIVTADESPLTLVATSPAEGKTWNADPDNEDCDGTELLVSLSFDKAIASIDESKAVTLTREEGGSYNFKKMGKSLLNATIGTIAYGALPNGKYTLSLPADVFVGNNGKGNSETTLHFTITGSKTEAWALPLYTDITSSIANGETVRSLTSVGFTMTREGYDDPISLLENAAPVTVTKVTEEYKEGVDYSDPEAMPDFVSTTVEGVTAKVVNGELVVSLAQPITEVCKVIVSVPQGIVNNLLMPVATMTPQEIFEEGGCTNPAILLTLNVQPVKIKVVDATGIGTFNHWEKDDQGHDVRVDDYSSLIDAQLTPPATSDADGDRVTYMYVWYEEPFATINYKGGASVTNVTTGKNYSIAAIEFKTGGDAYRNNAIQIRLSSENFIHSAEYDQGVYEVVLPTDIAFTADGMTNEGITFSFTYGDPDKAYVPEQVDLDKYIGHYENVVDEGEINDNPESFDFAKSDNGGYCLKNLCGCSTLVIPVEAKTDGFVLKFTENGDDAFMSTTGGDVIINFAEQDGKYYIYLDQYGLYYGDDAIVGGCVYYEQADAEGIHSALTYGDNRSASRLHYDLNGRRVNSAARTTIVISKDGKRIQR